jgi:hypothetical protein
MSVTFEERWNSRGGTVDVDPSKGDKDLVYIVSGTDDDTVAEATAAANLPAIYFGLLLQSFHVERVAELVWEVTARYGKKEKKEVGDSTFEFDTTGGTQHITQALETVGFAGVAGAPDLQEAINVTKDSVEGCDIVVPQYAWSESFIIDDADVDGAYKAILFALTGRTNDAPFRDFADGEVLFKGARGSKRGKDDWEINFSFAASPNVVGLQIGALPPCGDVKGGWDYVSVNYVDDVDANTLIKRPAFMRILRVYESGDFSLLGIGT